LAGHALFERIGVGGMGEVYRCGDDALGRDLAIKVIKADYCGHEGAERRFFREARVTGSLQHPGIVPIHNLGRLADGRPCYTMKLVRGRTLADILRDEPTGLERLPRLLAILEKVCHAVAYAHSKGVLHRDLKPSNVMVGKFGEVQVMDWGLAKVLPREDSTVRTAAVEEEAGTVLYTTPASMSEDMSRTGAALGTPSYMPPEQAMGERELVDERADVFALGAILCELLTGSPPYRAGPRDELLRRARRGDLSEALRRLEQCGADAALVQLCRECLAPEREGRPRNADVVAKRLAAYQVEVQERLRRAELERAEAQVKAREERKRRRLALLLSAAVLLVLVAGTLISLLFAFDAGRQATAARNHAENAENEKQRADENAKHFEEEKRLATQARDETETAFVAGLLRPIGATSYMYLPKDYLTSAEVDALMSLHDLRSDSTRVRFIEEGLRTAETARRLDRLAEWVIQASVGLDSGRRRKVQELLMLRLQDRSAPLEVREACVMLGVALNVQDPSFDNVIGEVTLELTRSFLQGKSSIYEVTDRLQEVCGRLDAASAAKIADLLISAWSKHSLSLHDLSENLALLYGRLDSSSAAAHPARVAANRVAANIVSEMRWYLMRRDAERLRMLAKDLQATCVQLDTATAAAYADKAAALLVEAMNKAPATYELSALAHELQAVCAYLDAKRAAAHAAKATDLLVAVICKTPNSIYDGSRPPPEGPPPVAEDSLPLPVGAPSLPAAKGDQIPRELPGGFTEPLPAPSPPVAKGSQIPPVGVATAPVTVLPMGFLEKFQSLSNYLDAASAAHVTEALLAAINKTTSLTSSRILLNYLLAVSRHLDASHAAKTADLLLAAMSEKR
jgi:serine/threonine protein kinase